MFCWGLVERKSGVNPLTGRLLCDILTMFEGMPPGFPLGQGKKPLGWTSAVGSERRRTARRWIGRHHPRTIRATSTARIVEEREYTRGAGTDVA